VSVTIREYVNCRLRWFYFACAIGFGLFFVPPLLNEREATSQLLKIAGLLTLTLGAIVMAGVRCPRCSKPLGRSFMWQRGTLELCPHCGVGLDEECRLIRNEL
jgi:hypothetical protein